MGVGGPMPLHAKNTRSLPQALSLLKKKLPREECNGKSRQGERSLSFWGVTKESGLREGQGRDHTDPWEERLLQGKFTLGHLSFLSDQFFF